jgi:uncharacterized phage-associated protein
MSNAALRAPLTATAVAAWFVDRAVQDPEQDLSNLKLQKLIYLAHSLFLHRHRLALVQEEVQAWENGPVVKVVYGAYKEFESTPIQRPSSSVATQTTWPDDIVEALEDVWRCFSGLSASKLRNITHIAGPWKDHWYPGSRNVVIPNDEIAAAWPELEQFAETRLVARANTVQAALARYGGLLGQLGTPQRTGDLSLQEQEARDFSGSTRRASSLLA